MPIAALTGQKQALPFRGMSAATESSATPGVANRSCEAILTQDFFFADGRMPRNKKHEWKSISVMQFNFGQTCTRNGQVGQCTADGAERTTCSCITASSRRSTQPNKPTHRCSAGKRWSPVRSACIVPLANSPDGRHSCGTWNGYFFDPDTNVCAKLFE